MTDITSSTALSHLRTDRHPAAKTGQQGPVSAEGAKRAAQEFEALFVAEMLAPVFDSLDSEGLFGGGQGEKVYRSMMVQEYGKAIAQAGGVGIADSVYREILKMQETQQ